ncbi:MAG TPA: SDR family oxidoreductase [Baekduia sp.]|nr:SDR family oxidoreductase [Baekduia sp.]
MSDPTRVAAVFGGSSGLGAAIAERFVADGMHTYVCYHTGEDRAQEIVRRAGGSATAAGVDVTDEASVVAFFERVTAEHGRLDVLVLGAVTEIAKSVEDATLDEWHTVVGTKLDQCFLGTKHALPLLKATEGSQAIYLTSHDGVNPDPDYIGYCTGTAGIIAFVKAMAKYLPRFGARANAISPGAVKTPLWDALGGDDPALWEQLNASNPLGRLATPEDIAAAAAWLSGSEARMINGLFLYVDGGSQWKS